MRRQGPVFATPLPRPLPPHLDTAGRMVSSGHIQSVVPAGKMLATLAPAFVASFLIQKGEPSIRALAWPGASNAAAAVPWQQASARLSRPCCRAESVQPHAHC